jgi:hypothetical protein
MTIISRSSKNKFSDAEQALSEVSKLLSRLCKSRKAGMKLPEIIGLTGVVARLTRALQNQGAEHGDGQNNDGYGDPDHFAKISAETPRRNLIR